MGRNKLIIGNWKMNGRRESNQQLLERLVAYPVAHEVMPVVCVPYPYLTQCVDYLSGSRVSWGAQDVSEYEAGAYTGEVSAGMLVDCGCRYVLVGHSERRIYFAESSESVARKAFQALQHGITAVVCVGESLAQRNDGLLAEVLEIQLGALLKAGVSLERCVIAYEPVWAIGTGRTADEQQVEDALRCIRQWGVSHGASASSLKVLYGGSVNAANAGALLALPDLDGVLVGGASLIADDFMAICDAAARV